MKVCYNFFLMVIGLVHLPYLSQAITPVLFQNSAQYAAVLDCAAPKNCASQIGSEKGLLPNKLILPNFTNSAPRLLDIVQNGYNGPSYSTKVDDEAALFRKTMRTQAMVQRCWISSMVIPGLGQVYNKDYWKVPCLYLGFAFLGYKIYSEHEEMHKHQRDALARNVHINHKLNPVFTEKRIKECERTRNLFIIIASAWYLLNILDAYAGGHDKTVNFNDDIQTKSTSKPTALLKPTAAAAIR